MVRNEPNASGFLMKSIFISWALAATKTSDPNSLFSPLSIWTRSGLNIDAARWGSAAHSPLVLLVAREDGTQPSGPVPVTMTLRAPNSYSLCDTNI